MPDGVGVDLPGAVRLTMDAAELAAERVELLPERMTLTAISINSPEFNPDNVAVFSPFSNNATADNHAEPEVVNGNGSCIQTFVSHQTVINQR
jgi:hypothetical protein